MKTGLLTSLLGVVLCVLAVGSPARAEIITFGSGPDQFDMEFVEIGSPGNAADTTGDPNPAGAVSYKYNISKFEVSESMIDSANTLGGLGITHGNRGADKPATSISWLQAARFVNWLNTSQGFQAAYKFDGSGNFQLWSSTDAWQLDGENLFRHKDAQYWLPSADEWYKAAYYDPVSDTYFDFPTGSDTAPTPVANGTAADTAVYNQPFSQGPADIMEAGGLSPFGTMGQGGNVWEWEETELDLLNDMVSSSRGVRGSGWSGVSSGLSSSFRFSGVPSVGDNDVGFRVASLSSDAAVVPEPSSLAVWTLLGVCGLWWGHRRLGK